jgi:release factor glutamine methyltransferase
MSDAPTAELPSLDHLTYRDFEHVYEPAEDTFLLCDAIESQRDSITCLLRVRLALEHDSVSNEETTLSRSLLCLEVGPGSGCAITFLGQLLTQAMCSITSEPSGICGHILWAIDVNPHACRMTHETAAANGQAVQCIQSDLFSNTTFEGAEVGSGEVDILLFNPPYVPTDDLEVGGDDISASWAGGTDGRVVIDRFLPSLPRVLARPHGFCLLLLVQENKPEELQQQLRSLGLSSTVVRRTRAKNEALQVLRIGWA